MICPSGIWGTEEQSEQDINTLKHSYVDITLHSREGDTDLYVVAISYYYIFLRDQVWHSILWDDILNLKRDKWVEKKEFNKD